MVAKERLKQGYPRIAFRGFPFTTFKVQFSKIRDRRYIWFHLQTSFHSDLPISTCNFSSNSQRKDSPRGSPESLRPTIRQCWTVLN